MRPGPRTFAWRRHTCCSGRLPARLLDPGTPPPHTTNTGTPALPLPPPGLFNPLPAPGFNGNNTLLVCQWQELAWQLPASNEVAAMEAMFVTGQADGASWCVANGY